MKTPLSFSILILFTDNERFVPHAEEGEGGVWGSCNLSNLATLLFTTFEISKHPTFSQCLI